MKYNKNSTDICLMNNIRCDKGSLIKDLEQNIINQQLCLDQFIAGINECNKKGLENTKVIWNLSALINIISLDLKVIQRALYQSTDDWSQRYYIRQAYLLIYEFFNTYYSKQKEFYEIINNKLNISSLQKEKECVIDKLRNYRKQHEKTFYNIRVKTVAHREGDIMVQVEYIENLNFSESINIMLEFDEILNDLGHLFQQIIKLGLNDIDLLK